MLVKKGQNFKIINLHDKTVIYTSRIKIRIYTSRFVFIHQDSYIYIKIRIYTARFVYIHQDLYIYIKIRAILDIKESMTTGSIIAFSNGDRKMAANEEAIFSLLRRVYKAMTEEVTPASNVEEELLRVFPFFFPCWCTAALFCAIHE